MKRFIFVAVYMFGIFANNAFAEELEPLQSDDMENLAFPVCSLWLPEKRKHDDDMLHYVEGDICPVGGGNCSYTAIIRLKGKAVQFQRVAKNRFTRADSELDVSYRIVPCKKNCGEEGENVKAQLTIKKGQDKTTYEMTGYCGT